MEKNFNPKKEKAIYENWQNQDYFSPKEGEPYTIMLPPPNITGNLHLGHALNITLQDILIRFKRMQGYAALWLPGTDHASISTEIKIVESLKPLAKKDLGREEFLKRAWAWKEEYGGIITEQLKKLGASCDWSREKFTMDSELSRAVIHVFVDLHKKGYIYKGEKLINWCPHCKTTISDAEVEHRENKANLYYLQYKVIDTDEKLTFATTRPETILGDTAIAVNPDDERYSRFLGKKVTVPIVNREIPIIADGHVSPEFGSGVVKVTPGHDFNDYLIAIRHDLPAVNIFTDEAFINENGGTYCGLERYEARRKVVEHFKEINQFVKIEETENALGRHDKCNTVMEPLNKLQWFVKMETLAKPAIDAYKKGSLNFFPERFSKIYLNWLENIQDWCISRQLWWGHRIPAYYCDDCDNIMVEPEKPAACICGCANLIQDEDVLDTWFSSALWPFSTLGWPDKTADFNKFFPTNVLVTGPDIIFFWVVRMVFSAMEHTGQIPFKDVILNGIVRDDQGRKMSKTLGNGIDPLEVIEEYGADPLRITLIMGNALGADQRFSKEKVEASRNFLNKIWNAARFIQMNKGEYEVNDLNLADKWIISKLSTLKKEMTVNMENYDLGLSLEKLCHFAWEEYCDWYIEMSKFTLKNNETKGATLQTLNYVLAEILRLLHPYAPFITEEIFTNIQTKEKTLMYSPWPMECVSYSKEEEIIESTKHTIKTIRNIRKEMNIPLGQKIRILIVGESAFFEEVKIFYQGLGGSKEVIIQKESPTESNLISIPVKDGIIYLQDMVDIEKEKARLTKEKQHLEKELARSEKMLNNKAFLEKAPQNLIDEEERKKADYQGLLEKVNVSLGNFGDKM